jgi:hypothetical protein
LRCGVSAVQGAKQLGSWPGPLTTSGPANVKLVDAISVAKATAAVATNFIVSSQRAVDRLVVQMSGRFPPVALMA